MYRAARISLVGLGLGLLVASTDQAFALEIWLSDVGSPGAGVVVDNPDREFDEPLSAQEMFIWVRPDAGETLGAIDLSLTSSNREVIDFTGATIHNPLLEQAVYLPMDVRRFEFLMDPMDPAIPDPSSSIQRIGGFDVTQNESLGVGLGPASTATDPLYDADADAWLLATVTYDVIGSGLTDLFLQIGKMGILQDGGSSADVDVVFGGGADRPLNGNTNRMVNSATPDGSITLKGDYLRPETWYDVPIVDSPDPDPVTVLPPDQGAVPIVDSPAPDPIAVLPPDQGAVPIVDSPNPDPVAVLPQDQGTEPVHAGNVSEGTVSEEPIDEVAGDDPKQSDGPAPDLPVDRLDRPAEDMPIFITSEVKAVRDVLSAEQWFILDQNPSDFPLMVLRPGSDLLDLVVFASDGVEGLLQLQEAALVRTTRLQTQDLTIPEPSTLLMLGIGLLSIVGTVRMRGNE